MKTFAYRNPLRGWEDLPFDRAIREGKRLLGGNGYIPDDDYRLLYREGRITDEAVLRALARIKGSVGVVTAGSRRMTSSEVLRLHLLFGFHALDPALLTWQLGAGGAMTRFRQDVPDSSRRTRDGDPSYLPELWNSALSALDLSDPRQAAHEQQAARITSREVALVDLPSGRTVGDWLESLAGISLVDRVNDEMVKWAAAFLDEGMAGWEMPGRHAGFYQTWRELAGRDFSGHFLGIRGFARKVRALPSLPEDAISLCLERLGIPEPRWTDYLARHMAQLPGWAGFIRWRSENPEYSAQGQHPARPVEYLAVRLFYELELVRSTCRREWGIDGTLCALVSHWEGRRDEYHRLAAGEQPPTDDHTRAVCRDAWRLFHLAQFLELSPADVDSLAPSDIRTLLGWLDSFPQDRHGAVWLEALELSYQKELLEQLGSRRAASPISGFRPLAQLVLCIDARSEPLRRQIEAQGPYETYGFAGFFGVPISYRAFDSEEHAALCPVIVRPGYEVTEVPRSGQSEALRSYASGSRWNQLGGQLFHDLKRSPLASLMLIDVLGLFFGVRLIGKTFFPRSYAAIRTWVRRWFVRPVATQVPVDLLQDGSTDRGEAAQVLPRGFTLSEQAGFVERGLRAVGLTRTFGRFIVLCGHGSTSDNNPYFAAYNCGACGGGHGDANARVFAAMGNKPEVRRILRENGLNIPDDTWFLAGKHNTTTDEVTFYDVQDVPSSHVEDLRRLVEDLERAGTHQALERCRRMPQAPRDVSPDRARHHVIVRSVDWANVRPEWGLSSNAAFILGRRALTSGVDLKGRVFLHSYDPETDPEGAVLEALMMAPLVVAQWISMQYYFSAVDPWIYGSGSKVTHNVVSGVGVMAGSQSDLLTGLPLQSVNDGAIRYHEPLRLLAIIEAPTRRISSAIQKHTLLEHLLHNQWIHLLAIDPATGEFHRYHPDATWTSCS